MENIELTNLVDSPFQPRTHYDPVKLQELADSIKQHGVQQAIKVRMRDAHKIDGGSEYEIIFGHRRVRAAGMAGLSFIPADFERMSDQAVCIAQLIENEQREDITALDESDAYARLMREFNMSADDIVQQTGTSRTQVYNRLKLQDLCADARTALQEGCIQAEVAQLLARLPKSVQQNLSLLVRLSGTEAQDAPSYRTAKGIIESFYTNLRKAPFAVEDDTLLPMACTACPSYGSNIPSLMADDPTAGRLCMDGDCYADKRQQHAERTIKVYKAKGAKLSKKGSGSYYAHEQEVKLGQRIDLSKIDKAIDKKHALSKILGDHITGAQVDASPNMSGAPLLTMTPSALEAALKKAGIEKPSELIERADKIKGSTSSRKSPAQEYEPLKLQRKKTAALQSRAYQALKAAIAALGIQPGVWAWCMHQLFVEGLEPSIEQQLADDLGLLQSARYYEQLTQLIASKTEAELAEICTLALFNNVLQEFSSFEIKAGEIGRSAKLCAIYQIDLAAMYSEIFAANDFEEVAAKPKRKAKAKVTAPQELEPML
jgi:ParB/RepB/Spo0J family partition protein